MVATKSEIETVRKELGPHDLDLTDSGMRICAGQDSFDPQDLQEDYFYIIQQYAQGGLHDPQDMRNRPYLMLLRGGRDLHVFLDAVDNHNRLQQIDPKKPMAPLAILDDSYSYLKAQQPSWPRLFGKFDEDAFNRQNCQINRDFVSDALANSGNALTKPFHPRDGDGIDFWQIYYCQPTDIVSDNRQ